MGVGLEGKFKSLEPVLDAGDVGIQLVERFEFVLTLRVHCLNFSIQVVSGGKRCDKLVEI
jgi:hypothetical protein